MTSAYACPYTLGEGRGNEIRGQPVGGGLCYIFFAGNRVMIDFKCYFIAIFFYSRTLTNDADRTGYIPILIVFCYKVEAQEAGGIRYIHLELLYKCEESLFTPLLISDLFNLNVILTFLRQCTPARTLFGGGEGEGNKGSACRRSMLYFLCGKLCDD